jgi:hypothetical protein
MFSFLTENRCTLVKSIASRSTNRVCEYDHTTATIAEIFRYFSLISFRKIQIRRLKKDRRNFLTNISQFIGKSNPDVIQRSETTQLTNSQ